MWRSSGDLAYVADGRNAGLRIVDISDPANPTFIGAQSSRGLALGVALDGAIAYLADGVLRAIDIASPTAPFETASLDTAGEAWDVAVDDLVYVADGRGGLAVVLDLTRQPRATFLPLVTAGNRLKQVSIP